MAARGPGVTPVVAISGPSGTGKTRLITRLIPMLRRRGVVVSVIKHTRHRHPFDVPGKDTDLFRRSGAQAAAILGPAGMAIFRTPVADVGALARLLPPCDLILAEGWQGKPWPRIEVHRRRVARDFLCSTDRRVFAVVTDEPPPRPVPSFRADRLGPLADLLVARFVRRPPARRPVSRRS